MSEHDIQQICLNGHQITDTYTQYPSDRSEFCDTCGAKTITQCPSCKSTIQGDYISSMVISTSSTPVPEFCKSCGTPFPWTKNESKDEAKNTRPVEPIKNVDSVHLLDHLCEKFHAFAREIKKRHDNRETVKINDEYDLQDALRALLRMFYSDVRPEEYTPSYAGSSSRIDYLLKTERIAVEVKCASNKLRDKKIGEQLIIDKSRYRDHPSANTLFCFVYDPDGNINNPVALENDLSEDVNGLNIIVKIYPKH